MSVYLQYHNVSKRGLKYLFVNDGWCGITTKLSHVQNASGTVLLIVGIGLPRRFFLWEQFQIEEIHQKSDGSFNVWGPGWQLSPPQRLEGPAFEKFKSSCASFVGFRRIDKLPYTQTLLKTAKQFRAQCRSGDKRLFLEQLIGLLKKGTAEYPIVAREIAKLGDEPNNLTPSHPANGSTKRLRALSIRQPFAEAIMRGKKRIEYRDKPTKIRGRVQIYASLGRFLEMEEAAGMAMHKIKDIACDDLPRGVLIGTVEITDCKWNGHAYEWHLRHPQRAKKLLKPTRQPQPVWFNPF